MLIMIRVGIEIMDMIPNLLTTTFPIMITGIPTNGIPTNGILGMLTITTTITTMICSWIGRIHKNYQMISIFFKILISLFSFCMR